MNQMSSLSTRRSNKNLSAKQLFDKYEDGSGKISFSEFQNMLPDMGIQLSIPKQIEYFRLCDKDENGQIDFEEFKVALYVSDTEEVNHIGFNPGTILRPRGKSIHVQVTIALWWFKYRGSNLTIHDTCC